MEPELPDKGKQTKRVHVLDGIGPTKRLDQGVNRNGKGVMKMRNSGDVPGGTGQGACAKTAHVVDKIGDDRFDNLPRKPGSRG